MLPAFSLGSVPSRLFSPPNTPQQLQETTLLLGPPPSVPRPPSLSLLAGEGRSVFGELEECLRGKRDWLWRFRCLCLSTGSGGDLEELWWESGDRSLKRSSLAWDDAAVSPSLSSGSLLTISWSNDGWEERRAHTVVVFESFYLKLYSFSLQAKTKVYLNYFQNK